MNPETVIGIGQHALLTTAILAAPLLLSALIVGVAVGMLQAATQINEATLSFIPKLLVVVGTLFATGHWMLETLMDYTRTLFQSIPGLIG